MLKLLSKGPFFGIELVGLKRTDQSRLCFRHIDDVHVLLPEDQQLEDVFKALLEDMNVTFPAGVHFTLLDGEEFGVLLSQVLQESVAFFFGHGSADNCEELPAFVEKLPHEQVLGGVGHVADLCLDVSENGL